MSYSRPKAKWYRHFETVWQFISKLNIFLPYDPAIAVLGIYPKKLKAYVHNKDLDTNVYRNFTDNCQNLEAT